MTEEEARLHGEVLRLQTENNKLRTIYPDAYLRVRHTATKLGWGVAVHGSQANDLDILAVPWRATAVSAAVFLKKVTESVSGTLRPHVTDQPHGRRSYHIVFPYGIIDLSVIQTTDIPARMPPNRIVEEVS